MLFRVGSTVKSPSAEKPERLKKKKNSLDTARSRSEYGLHVSFTARNSVYNFYLFSSFNFIFLSHLLKLKRCAS